MVSWFEWSKNQKLPVDALEDLILVNGCTLVDSWAAVTFVGRTGPAEISLVAQTPERSERSFEFPNIQGDVAQHCSYFNSVRFSCPVHSPDADVVAVKRITHPRINAFSSRASEQNAAYSGPCQFGLRQNPFPTNLTTAVRTVFK